MLGIIFAENVYCFYLASVKILLNNDIKTFQNLFTENYFFYLNGPFFYQKLVI